MKRYFATKVALVVLMLLLQLPLTASLVGGPSRTAVALNITDISVGGGSVEGGTEITIRGDFQVNQIAAGEYHTCTIDADGLAYCWGENGYGQLGNDSNADSSVPVAVDTAGALAEKKLTYISAGAGHNCAIDAEGAVYCWGSNSNGQLGSSGGNSAVPRAVDTSGVLAGKKLVTIMSGNYHTCATDADGKAYCWGSNVRGQLGNGLTTDSSVPVAVDMSGLLAGKSLKRVATGYTHTCAIDAEGKAYCWGDGGIGRLGNGTTTTSLVPVAVDDTGALLGKTLVAIGANEGYTCALDTEGLGYCWGWNQYGQFGSGGYPNSSVPLAMDTSELTSDLSGKALTYLNAGMAHACGVDTEGAAYCWGFDGQGQLGTNAVYMQSLSAVAVDMAGELDGKVLTRISAGSYHTCALDSDGRVYCWGEGSSGQLGNGSRAASLLPARVSTSVDEEGLPTASALPPDTEPTYKIILDAGGSPAECRDVTINIQHTVMTCVTTAHIGGGAVDVMVDNGVSASALPSAFVYIDIEVPNSGFWRI